MLRKGLREVGLGTPPETGVEFEKESILFCDKLALIGLSGLRLIRLIGFLVMRLAKSVNHSRSSQRRGKSLESGIVNDNFYQPVCQAPNVLQ